MYYIEPCVVARRAEADRLLLVTVLRVMVFRPSVRVCARYVAGPCVNPVSVPYTSPCPPLDRVAPCARSPCAPAPASGVPVPVARTDEVGTAAAAVIIA